MCYDPGDLSQGLDGMKAIITNKISRKKLVIYLLYDAWREKYYPDLYIEPTRYLGSLLAANETTFISSVRGVYKPITCWHKTK